MTNEVYLEVRELLGLSETVGDIADALRKRQTSIDDDVDELLTTWTGPAATSYESEWTAISESSTELITDLFYIEELLAWAARELGTTDHDNSGDIDTVGLNL